MRHFQALLLAMLAVISVELGLVVMKLPTPVAQAGPPNVVDPQYKGPTWSPAALEEKLEPLKTQNERILKLLDTIWGEVKSVRVLMATNVDMKSLRSDVDRDTTRLVWVCYMMNEHYFKPGAPAPGAKEVLLLERQFQTSQLPPCAP